MCEPWRFSPDFSDVQACFNLPLMPKSNKTKQIQNLSLVLPAKAQTSLCIYPFLQEHSLLMRNVLIVYVSNDMRFPTMWYVRPAKAQTSLRIRAVWSEPLLLAWIFYEFWATQWISFRVSKLKRGLHRLVWVCTCQNATFLEITCHGSCV